MLTIQVHICNNVLKLKDELPTLFLNINVLLLFSFSCLSPNKRTRNNGSRISKSAWKSAGWCASKVPLCVWTLVWSLGISLTRQGTRNSPKRARKWTTSCGLRCCFTKVGRCWRKGWQSQRKKQVSKWHWIKNLNLPTRMIWSGGLLDLVQILLMRLLSPFC